MIPKSSPSVLPLGDAAVVVTFGDDIDPDIHERVMAFAQHLDSSPPPAMVEYIPAFTTVTLTYDPLVRTYDEFIASVQTVLDEVGSRGETKDTRPPVEIPVYYGDELGPDLDFVASHNDLTPEEVVKIHSGTTYLVFMVGFAPGFPYLGGMSPRIAAPRLDSPRTAVPAGSVGIAGAQTGVYSIETPGGWRLVGRTPLKLFEPTASAPSLLHAGDHVRFLPIDRGEYETMAREATS
ncbi:MAG: 5-oxoprolinase subunit PxpB [Actinomycetota bacterium]|nr:5-oxoprolinase subunit PxpB [Actinomycetota bacterium]